ncbi:MAG: InlB B-repeat-containing protein, partial [Clostridia bacterium]|nr:InlB B-repeat-containing protein [Clostridia bacterium]
MQKKMKKGLSLLLTVVLTLGVFAVGLPGLVTIAKADTWDGNYSDSSGFQNNTITSARGFVYFLRTITNNGTTYSGQTVRLAVDVDLADRNLMDALPYDSGRVFQGTFDGQNHTISHLRMVHDNHRVAMFRTAKNATFRNVTVADVFIDDTNNNGRNGFAVFVGYGDGNLTFENVHVVNGNIYGYNYVGGFVGEYGANDTLRFTNCSNGALVYADNNRAGGLVDHSKGSVYATDCSNTGNIYAGAIDVGGLAGWIEDDPSAFVNCTNSGSVETPKNTAAGGIVGYFGDNDSVIQFRNSTNTGSVTTAGQGGGIIGHIVSDAAHVFTGNVNRGTVSAGVDGGGICGSNEGAGTWTDNYNYGSVTGSSDNAGGMLGEVQDDANTFERCYNVGNVTGKNSIGGILGYGNAAAHTFTSCGNSGTITSTGDCAAGIYGYGGNSNPVCTECWNIGNIYAYHDAGGIIGKTSYHSIARRCFNAGNVGTYNNNGGSYHGGITGYTGNFTNASASNAQIEDCYNWGNVSGGSLNAGIVAYVQKGDTNWLGGGGNRNYYVKNSYSTGTVSGGTAKAMVADGGSGVANCYKTIDPGNGWGDWKTDQEMIDYSNFTLSSNFCKNTWGVKIGSKTYYYPVLTWYRNMFTFTSIFEDAPTNTHTTFTKTAYNGTFTTPNPSRTGYTPGNWYVSTDSSKTIGRNVNVSAGVTAPTNTLVVTQSFTDLLEITNTTTYYLAWTAHTYTVSFNGNGATGGGMEPLGFTYDVAQNLPANGFLREYDVTFQYNDDVIANTTARATYTFNGWATSANGPKVYNNQASVSNLTATNGGNVTLFALWNSASVTLPVPTRNGYTFDGWCTDSGLTDVLSGTTYTPTANKTLYAKWTVIDYTITYDLDGGSATNPTTYAVDTATFTLANPTKVGYTFTGWSGTGLTGSANMTVTIPAGSTGNRSYTAHWSINQYTITFNTDGGSAIAPITQNYGTAITAPADPTKANHAFGGWVPAIPATMPAGDLTVTAQWTRITTNDTFILSSNRVTTLHVLSNDAPGATLTAVTGGTGFTTDIANGKITFTPTATLSSAVTFTYTASYGGTTGTATVTVVPASNVYYEENGFITFTDGS